MCRKNLFALVCLANTILAQLDAIPEGFNASQWAWVSNKDPLLAVIPGTFNRTVYDAPSAANVSDQRVVAMSVVKSLLLETLTSRSNEHINQSSFVAYDERFFDIIGSSATVEQLQELTFQVHEAPCYIPSLHSLFFVQWGPPGGGENGGHDYQYLLDLTTNNLTEVRTDPPSWNVHGCVYRNNLLHIVTDGGPNETAYLATIDPETWKRTTLLNTFYERPFMSFNDLEMDRAGNYYLTDSYSGQGRTLNPYSAPTPPTVYFVDGKTMRPRELAVLPVGGNTNGITLSPDDATLYLADTGATGATAVKGIPPNPQGGRDIYAWDFAVSKTTGQKLPLLTNRRPLNRAMQYFYDGIRVSANGYIWGTGGEVVDVIDPESGWTLGSVSFGGGGNDPVNLVMGENEFWVVGKGGVWHVKGVQEKMALSYD